jgi:hypothetical protein
MDSQSQSQTQTLLPQPSGSQSRSQTASLRACIGLTVYKNAISLPLVFRNIEAIRPLFKRLVVIVSYDISPDETEAVLEALRARYGPKDMEILKNTNPRSPIRTERICNARNWILERIRNVYPDFEYFMMMDANEYSCVGPIRPAVLAAALERSAEWDALSFDREAGYYDYWALSYDPFVYSCYHFDKPYVLETMRANWREKLSKAQAADPKQLLEVYSAFNGFAIYKADPFLKCTYAWKIDMRFFPVEIIIKQSFVLNANIAEHLVDDCEHRKFHLEAIRDYGARVRVSLDSLFEKVPELEGKLRGPA